MAPFPARARTFASGRQLTQEIDFRRAESSPHLLALDEQLVAALLLDQVGSDQHRTSQRCRNREIVNIQPTVANDSTTIESRSKPTEAIANHDPIAIPAIAL